MPYWSNGYDPSLPNWRSRFDSAVGLSRVASYTGEALDS